MRRYCGAGSEASKPARDFRVSTVLSYEITAAFALPPYVTSAVDGEVTPGNTP